MMRKYLFISLCLVVGCDSPTVPNGVTSLTVNPSPVNFDALGDTIQAAVNIGGASDAVVTVSYTHLTLPTILLV